MFICDDCVKDKDIVKHLSNKQLMKCDFCGIQKITQEITHETIRCIATDIMKQYSFSEYSRKSSAMFSGVIMNNGFLAILSKMLNMSNHSEEIIKEFEMETGFDSCFLSENGKYSDMHLLRPMSDDDAIHSDWLMIEDLLEKDNYYDVNPGIDHFKSLSMLEYKINPDQHFYRARLGCNKVNGWCDDLERIFSFPYVKDEMLAPPPMLCTSGRLNRHGISHLYMANNRDTAISEIKPSPGNICSIAIISNTFELRMIDLRKESIDDKYFDLGHNSYYFYYTVAKRLSEPIEPQMQNKYLITQYLSERIRKENFDGIVYNSAITDGINYLVFDNKKASIVNDSEFMVKIKQVSYKYDDCDDERKTYDCPISFDNDDFDEKYGISRN
ncbi:hypothetical protein AGMMS49940_11490 [Spirochaetia bacterium]|nr:hypothetical protein AGMMS49940_11490 [Spirochaetia bacterium]